MKIKELRFKHGRRKHVRGKTPCGNCDHGAHRDCRPRLDGQLCSCTCEQAVIARAEFERKTESAARRGLPQPTVAEALEILYPSYEQRF